MLNEGPAPRIAQPERPIVEQSAPQPSVLAPGGAIPNENPEASPEDAKRGGKRGRDAAVHHDTCNDTGGESAGRSAGARAEARNAETRDRAASTARRR